MSEIRDALSLEEQYKDSSGTGRTVDLEAIGDELELTIDDPNYGDTETGWGANLHTRLNREQVVKLVAFLLKNFLAH